MYKNLVPAETIARKARLSKLKGQSSAMFFQNVGPHTARERTTLREDIGSMRPVRRLTRGARVFENRKLRDFAMICADIDACS